MGRRAVRHLSRAQAPPLGNETAEGSGGRSREVLRKLHTGRRNSSADRAGLAWSAMAVTSAGAPTNVDHEVVWRLNRFDVYQNLVVTCWRPD